MDVSENDDNIVHIFHPRKCKKFCLQIWSQKNFFGGVQSRGIISKTFLNCNKRANTPTKEPD